MNHTEIDKETYRAGETLRLTIVNYGEKPVVIGKPYTVYRLANGTWILCRELTPSIGDRRGLPNTGRSKLHPDHQPGKAEPELYKVVKSAYGYHDSIGLLLKKVFRVVGKP